MTINPVECPVCGPPSTPDYDTRYQEGPELDPARLAGYQAAELLGHRCVGGCKVDYCGLCYDEYMEEQMGTEAYRAMCREYEAWETEQRAACTCGRLR